MELAWQAALPTGVLSAGAGKDVCGLVSSFSLVSMFSYQQRLQITADIARNS
jgi:hypothetical protein